MSTTVVERRPGVPAPFPRADATAAGRRRRLHGGVGQVRRAGYVVLGLQLAVLLAWSVVRADRFALSWDFSIYYQAWWLIAHGHLDPFDTLNAYPFWASHGELLLWPLAVAGLLRPDPVTLLGIQCLGLVGAEAAAFSWLCDVAGGARPWVSPRMDERAAARSRSGAALAATGLVLLVADPWTYWAASFDFHLELVGICFVVLTARQLHRDPASRLVWVWVALALLCGDVVTTYVAAAGVGAALAGRRWRRRGLAVAAVAVAWAALLAVVHADRASGIVTGYGYLAAGTGAGVAAPGQLGLAQLAEGVLRHPHRLLTVLWQRRLDLYASVAAGGLLGVVSPWVAPVAAVVLAENLLNMNRGFAVPGFQGALLYVLIPVGTVQVLTMLARRRRRVSMALAAVVAAGALGWGGVWLPRASGQWLRVSPAAGSVLSSVARRIPPRDEVVASQGIAGPFSGRRWFFGVQGPTEVPVRTSPVWVVVAPAQGIETATVSVADGLVAELAGPLHAQVVAHRAGVWAFRWVPSPGTRHLTVPSRPPTLGAWSASGAAGQAVLDGPEADWRADGTGATGYVVSGDYWQEPPGRYRATVTLSATVPVDVEVWDATGDALLARRRMPPTDGPSAVTMAIDARHRYRPSVYAGTGPFVVAPVPPSPDDQLEIRVWSPGGGTVSVASLELVPAGS